MINTLYIPGGFDILHQDHKNFIKNGISSFKEKYGEISRLIVGLSSDNTLNKIKGKYRPFFSYEWRKEDIINFLYKDNKNLNFDIIELFDKIIPDSINWSNTIIQVSTEYREGINKLKKKGFKILEIPPIDLFHTTDLEEQLFNTQKKSNCNLRKVGALLIREGNIIKEGYSGSGNCNLCKKYLAYSFGGAYYCKDVPCDFPHAEEICLEESKEGDDLLTTTSPCMECAKKIVKNKLRRITFINNYYNLKPLEYLISGNISIRKAGI